MQVKGHKPDEENWDRNNTQHTQTPWNLIDSYNKNEKPRLHQKSESMDYIYMQQ